MSQPQFYPQFESIIEDTVQCLFFSPSLNDSDTLWEQLCSDINNSIEEIAKDYIWHKEKLRINLPIDDNKPNGLPPHLVSKTCFGDNIEDEWFIVHVVFQLTKQFDDLIVQVTDNDGEFLLIEAANFLPSWANPENTDNRVFIANGLVHIIQPNVVNEDTKLDLNEAIKIVSEKQTLISSNINHAILTRIGSYPEKIRSNLHNAVVNLPISIATLLCLKPALIAPIVCAYCEHDVIDAKACQNISFENCITVKVTFTKFLYAMLTHSKLLKCRNKNKYISQNDKKNTIGFKLACGLQMIMKWSNDLFSTKEYHKFVSNLKDNGYFKNNIEGSKEYNVLLEKAKNFFTDVECPINLHVCNEITQIMSSDEYAMEMDRIQINNSAAELFDDNEDWLNVKPDQLNEFLNMNYGNKTQLKKDDVITPAKITSELSNFLTKFSDFEGIEMYDEDNDSNNINFDADEFSSCLENMLTLLSTQSNSHEINVEKSEEDETNADSLGFEDRYEREMDVELNMKLNSNDKNDLCTNNSISQYIIQSIKEEQSSSGPSSNLLRVVGIQKSDLLDSDDD